MPASLADADGSRSGRERRLGRVRGRNFGRFGGAYQPIDLLPLAGAINRKTLLLSLTGLMAVSASGRWALAANYAVYMLGRALIGVVIGGFWSLLRRYRDAAGPCPAGAAGIGDFQRRQRNGDGDRRAAGVATWAA